MGHGMRKAENHSMNSQNHVITRTSAAKLVTYQAALSSTVACFCNLLCFCVFSVVAYFYFVTDVQTLCVINLMSTCVAGVSWVKKQIYAFNNDLISA